MTKEDFLELVKKYEIGVCSEKEEKILFKYCEDLQAKDKLSSWNFSEEEQVRIKILRKIHQSIKEEVTVESENIRRLNPINYFKWSAAVVVFLAISTVTYLNFRYTKSHKIPTDEISLELQDGIILPLNDDDKKVLTDAEGNVIGRQVGNTLIYAIANKLALGTNTLRVPNGKTFKVILSDGTKMHLNAGSSVSYPILFSSGKQRAVALKGEAFLDVAKDKSRPFVVDAGGFNIRVLGTHFNVHAYPEDEVAEVVLIEGAVRLYTGKKNGLDLEPGYRAIFTKAGMGFAKNKVRTDVYTAWMDGELVIGNMTFSNILKKLERVYDVTIMNNNRALSNEVFNANFGARPPLETVLGELKVAYGINYTIKGKLITIN